VLGLIALSVLGAAAIRGARASWTEHVLLALGMIIAMGAIAIVLTTSAYLRLFKSQYDKSRKQSRPLFWIFVDAEYKRFGLASLLMPVPVFSLVWFFLWKVCVEQPFTWSLGIGIAGGLFTSGVVVLIHAIVRLEQWYDQT